MTIFDVRIPGLPMSVVQADGNDVTPVSVDEFRISVAETYDVIVQPQDESAHAIFAQSEDRTGYAWGTLAPRYGMSVSIPPLDPRPLRTMADMGMGNMSGKSMGGTGNMSGMEMGGTSGTEMKEMPTMEMGNPPEYVKRSRMVGPNAPGQPGPRTSAEFAETDMGDMRASTSEEVEPSLGSQVDNFAEMPMERLSSAGEGFPPGRRVLSYADLRDRKSVV